MAPPCKRVGGPARTSRLGGELQPAGLLHGLDIEGPQFGRAVDVDQHRDAAGRSRRRDQPRALRQGDDAVGADGTAAAAEDAVADHADHGGDCDQGGKRGYDHHRPRPRHQCFRVGAGWVTGYVVIRYLGHGQQCNAEILRRRRTGSRRTA